MFSVRKALPIAVAAGLLALPALGSYQNVAFASTPISISASNWKFTPNKIEARVGEATTLRLQSAEGVHGIKSDDLGISATTIVPGKAVEVTFTPKKAGTYVLHCAIPCGPGHDDMALTIVVKA